jgi:NOL1/NOP2/sun family putative RNA methylase
MSKTRYKSEMKPAFEERMRALIPDKKDFENYEKIIHTPPLDYLRCNTLKISPEELIIKLRAKGWQIQQPYPDYPEIMLLEKDLGPGELGNALEHQLGYYYIQEISSMLPIIALDPKPDELVLDLCASPGSKTTQIAARMSNQGTIIANDLKIDRISILVSNLERCGVTNTIITRKDALALTSSLAKNNFKKFDKILLDVPCSGEGTLRSSPKTFLQWNPKVIKKLSRQQKKFFAFAVKCLKKNGVLVYSTCTHAPEENEEVISFALENFPLKAEIPSLPVKGRKGITNWKNDKFHKDVSLACRIYPQDNNTEGFFVSKFTLLEEVK